MGTIGGISPGGSIALGIIVGLLSTCVQSLGLTLQRKSHILEDEKHPHEHRRPPHRRRRWQLGMAMFIVSNILGSTIQISTLPLPVLSTLQASGLVFNSICATLILGEPFTRWSLYGTCLVCTGAVLIAVFGAIPAPTHSLDELLDLMVRRPFVLWMILQALVILSISGATEFSSILAPRLAQDPRFRLVRGLAFGCVSGMLSAHSLLVAKLAVELIIKTIIYKDNQFIHWQSWVLVITLVVVALSQLYYLHRGLKLVSTSVLYPLVFCIYNIIAILDGLIYFHQTHLIKPIQAALITVGTFILLTGVLALSWRLSEEQHPPAVGQGSLAPGLGLVEDTDGEEDEMDLIDSDIITSEEDEGQPLLGAGGGYQTFGSRSTNGGVGATPPTPSILAKQKKKKKEYKWEERREIWGELLDRDADEGAGGLGKENMRRRSMTLPVFHDSGANGSGAAPRTPLGPPGSSGDGGGGGGGGARVGSSGGGEGFGTPTKRLRRRRKSTGFPGFIARKMPSRRVTIGSGGTGPEVVEGAVEGDRVRSPFVDAVNGILKLRFWGRGNGDGGGDGEGGRERDLEAAGTGSGGTAEPLPGRRWRLGRFGSDGGEGDLRGERYRDDDDARGGDAGDEASGSSAAAAQPPPPSQLQHPPESGSRGGGDNGVV